MRVVFSDRAIKQFKKIDFAIQKRMKHFINELEGLENPYVRGKRLSSNLSGFWRYRVGDYRLICKIFEDELVILLVDIGHRSEIY